MAVVMVYDLETIPDVVSGRRLLGLPLDTPDKAVAEALFQRRAEQTQGASQFLPHHLQKIVAISVVVATPEWVKVWSLGDLDASESDILNRFFEGIQRYTPDLVSWNGSGFDLPVLHYRTLLNGVVSSRYWETGLKDPQFKWNNYINRYHERHLDLMDVLAAYQPRANAPLDEMAVLLGFPGKMGMHGGEVFERYESGDLVSIRNYCETDVLNTYLIYLRFQWIRGYFSESQFVFEQERLKDFLKASEKPHLLEFLTHWDEG